MQDLSVQELRDLYARLIGPHPVYAYKEAKDRMRTKLHPDVISDGFENMLITLSLRLEIVEALLAGKKEA